MLAKQVVSNAAGTKVTFDVTSLVKAAVAGQLGSSRYTRVVLVDVDSATTDSTRNFYTPDDANSALRPTLKVVYGTTTTTPPPSATTLRVLQWNSQHNGVGTDGVLDSARFIKKAASFKPDLVSINEVERFDSYANYDGSVKLHALMEQYSGLKWDYKFTTNYGSADGRGNLILSRFPIVSSGVRLLDRGAVAEVIVTVNGRTINFMYDPPLLQFDELAPRPNRRAHFMGEGTAERRIIAGDFNAPASSTETATMKATYIDSWAQAQSDGTAIAYLTTRMATRGKRASITSTTRRARLR